MTQCHSFRLFFLSETYIGQLVKGLMTISRLGDETHANFALIKPASTWSGAKAEGEFEDCAFLFEEGHYFATKR